MQRRDLKHGQSNRMAGLTGDGPPRAPHDPDFEETLKIADDVMDEYKQTFTALAKMTSTR